jgi:hypothetical protein
VKSRTPVAKRADAVTDRKTCGSPGWRSAQLRARQPIHLELVHDPAAVRLDGVLACAELMRDLTIDEPSRQEVADFALAPREPRQTQCRRFHHTSRHAIPRDFRRSGNAAADPNNRSIPRHPLERPKRTITARRSAPLRADAAGSARDRSRKRRVRRDLPVAASLLFSAASSSAPDSVPRCRAAPLPHPAGRSVVGAALAIAAFSSGVSVAST